MGLLNRLFESKTNRLQRERDTILVKIIDAFSKTIEIEGGPHSPSFLGYASYMRDNVPKLLRQVPKDDMPILFLVSFLSAVGMEADAYIEVGNATQYRSNRYKSVDKEISKVVIGTLSIIKNNPTCLEEAVSLLNTGLNIPVANLFLNPTSKGGSMMAYEKFWDTFIPNNQLVCPLDIGKDIGTSARSYVDGGGTL